MIRKIMRRRATPLVHETAALVIPFIRNMRRHKIIMRARRRQMIARAAGMLLMTIARDQQPLTAIFIDIIIRECFSAVRASIINVCARRSMGLEWQ